MPKVDPRNEVGGARGQSQHCGRELLATDLLMLLALALPGKLNCWTEDEMFATNKQLLGHKTMATLMKRGSTSWARDALIHTPSG
jgi:hypothetical protein